VREGMMIALPFAVTQTTPHFNTCSHLARLAYPQTDWNHLSAPIHGPPFDPATVYTN
jgi:hypothetical protein